MLSELELKLFLDEKLAQYNTSAFIDTDPIQVPHRFCKPEDIEIAALLTSSIAWGKRETIIKNADKLLQSMDNEPYEFTMKAGKSDLFHLLDFKHRTFNGQDLVYFIKSLRNIYQNYGGLSNLFQNNYSDIKNSLINFRKVFLSIPHNHHVEKHVADVLRNSAAKRLNLFLMWMVRKDASGVHFGLWDKINPSDLMLPLDVHTGNISRKLGLLKRKQNDWNAVEEITNKLRQYDPHDPVKYDFALFGLGVFENF